MEITLAIPFVVSGIMFIIKWLAGLQLVSNGATAHPWLRAILIVVTFLGVVASSFLNGTPVDPNQVTSLVSLFVNTGVLAYFAHAFYKTAFAH